MENNICTNTNTNTNTTSGYYIALIIITLIGFILSLVLSFYFVYLPAQRSAAAFDDIQERGTDVINNAFVIADELNETATVTTDFLSAFCAGIVAGNGQLVRITPPSFCNNIVPINGSG
jgi:hypothetical protein